MDGTAPSITTRLPVAALRVWPGNPRKTVDPVALVELTTSVVALGGVKTPLLVRRLPTPEGEVTHEVIAGQRRYLAARDAGCVDVPVTIDDLDDAQALELALSENGARRGAPPLEDAEAIERLIVEHGRSEVRAAAILGHSLRWVERRRSLLRLIPEARGWLAGGALPVGHAEALAAISADAQFTVLSRYRIGADRTTFREVGSLAAFAREITYALHLLSSAPFDVVDEGLPGGACAKCPKRSGAQRDLFAKEVDASEHCLDTACWDGKTEAVWAREVKRAKRKKLTVIQDGSEVFTTWGATLPSAPYLTVDEARRQLPNAELKVVAIGRDEKGCVHELVAREAVKAARVATEARVAEDEDGDTEEVRAAIEATHDAERKARRDEGAARASKTLAALRTLPLTRLARAALLGADPWEIADVVRATGRPDYSPHDDLDGWALGLADGEVVEIALASMAADRFEMVAGGHDEPTPAEREVYGALLDAEATGDEVVVDEPPVAVTAPDGGHAPAEEPAARDEDLRVVFCIGRKVWDGLSAKGRDQLRRPDGATHPAEHVAWTEYSTVVRSEPLEDGDVRLAALDRLSERVGLVVAGIEVPYCRGCGCIESIACEGGCAWTDGTKRLCTACNGPATEGLVEIELDDWPSDCAALDVFDDTRVVLWTSNPGNDQIRTIVPVAMAAEVRARAVRAGVKGIAERPSTGPSHVVEVGGMVATPDGDRRILGLATSGGRPVDALVLDTPDGPRVALLDCAAESRGHVDIVPDKHYAVTRVDGAWCYSERAEAPRAKAKAPKKSKAAATKFHRDQGHPFDTQVTIGAPNVACVVIGGQLVKRPKGQTDEAWRKAVAVDVAAEPESTVTRLYSQRGVCLWDSRDGGAP